MSLLFNYYFNPRIWKAKPSTNTREWANDNSKIMDYCIILANRLKAQGFNWRSLRRKKKGGGFFVAQMVKDLPAMQETRVWSLGQEDPMEKEMATNSNIFAWRIPWTEEPGRLWSMGSHRVGRDWATITFTRRKKDHLIFFVHNVPFLPPVSGTLVSPWPALLAESLHWILRTLGLDSFYNASQWCPSLISFLDQGPGGQSLRVIPAGCPLVPSPCWEAQVTSCWMNAWLSECVSWQMSTWQALSHFYTLGEHGVVSFG